MKFKDSYFKITNKDKVINANLLHKDSLVKDIVEYMKLLDESINDNIHYHNSMIFNDIFMQLVLRDIKKLMDIKANENYVVKTRLNDDIHYYSVSFIDNKEIGTGYTIAKTLKKI